MGAKEEPSEEAPSSEPISEIETEDDVSGGEE